VSTHDGSGTTKALLPLEEGFFVMPDADNPTPRLIASYSRVADEYFFPRRKRCPVTFASVEDRLLSPRGVLYSWTWIATMKYGSASMGGDPHGVGQVDLPEGVRVQTRLLGAMGDWEIGMPMVIDLLPIAKDADGNDLCTFCFRVDEGGA
jgi:uncharacterized OB-fold protein